LRRGALARSRSGRVGASSLLEVERYQESVVTPPREVGPGRRILSEERPSRLVRLGTGLRLAPASTEGTIANLNDRARLVAQVADPVCPAFGTGEQVDGAADECEPDLDLAGLPAPATRGCEVTVRLGGERIVQRGASGGA
jgi:hypothetical protein